MFDSFDAENRFQDGPHSIINNLLAYSCFLIVRQNHCSERGQTRDYGNAFKMKNSFLKSSLCIIIACFWLSKRISRHQQQVVKSYEKKASSTQKRIWLTGFTLKTDGSESFLRGLLLGHGGSRKNADSRFRGRGNAGRGSSGGGDVGEVRGDGARSW